MGWVVVESWESQLEGLTALTFQVLTIKQKSCGAGLKPFHLLMYKSQQFLPQRFKLATIGSECLRAQIAKPVIDSALRNTHHQRAKFTNSGPNVGYQTSCTSATTGLGVCELSACVCGE